MRERFRFAVTHSGLNTVRHRDSSFVTISVYVAMLAATFCFIGYMMLIMVGRTEQLWTLEHTLQDPNDPLNAANIRACMLELPEYTELASLGIGVMVREVSADQGRVLLAYEGPANLRRAAEFNLANALREAESRVRKVDFVLGSDADER